mgnify:CR=1 FL=1
MEKVDILIIGAGAVGLAIANELANEHEDVVLVEKEKSFGRHTSSRNSEVIHSGIYYPQNTLKAELCLEGNELLYEFLSEHEIPHKNCGKLVVAASESEIEPLKELMLNGKRNNVPNLSLIDEKECKAMEPEVKAKKGLLVPSTGIFDTHKFMQKLESLAEDNDAFILYGMEVISITPKENKYVVEFQNGEKFMVNTVINSAGLNADKIAEMVGIDIVKHKLKIHLCKGEYYKTNQKRNIKKLIYPRPDPHGIYLGIHLTMNLNNEIRFGPNAYYVDEIDYSMDDRHKTDFLKSVNTYLDIKAEDIHMDDTGIRPKLQGPNDDFRDFYIKEESQKGYANFINLIGIESPGLTASLAIANKVKKLLD